MIRYGWQYQIFRDHENLAITLISAIFERAGSSQRQIPLRPLRGTAASLSLACKT
jgi:hypothetical protein